jgi:hypothetical protein
MTRLHLGNRWVVRAQTGQPNRWKCTPLTSWLGAKKKRSAGLAERLGGALMVLFIAGPVWRASASVDVRVVRAENVLSQVAPAILTPFLVRVFGLLQFAGYIDCLAPQMNAWQVFNRVQFVVVLCKGHDLESSCFQTSGGQNGSFDSDLRQLNLVGVA